MIENADFIFQKIQIAFEQGKVSWRQHALARMLERNISRKDVFTAIKAGNVIESYPESKPYPGLLIAYADEEISIHVVVSWDSGSDFAYVITSYIPDDIHFEKNGNTRKKGDKMTFSKGCPYCGGMIEDGTTTFTVDKKSVLVVVRGVPAHICQQCGETWIMDNIAEELEGYIVSAEKNNRQFEVVSMAA